MPCQTGFQIQTNYAVNAQGPLYEPASQHPGGALAMSRRDPNALIFNPTLRTWRGELPARPGGPCIQLQTLSAPLNPWAQGVVTADTRLNIDGRPVRGNLCLYACDNTGNTMINPVPYQPSQYYTLPGAVPSAIKFFKPCGPRPAVTTIAQALRDGVPVGN